MLWQENSNFCWEQREAEQRHYMEPLPTPTLLYLPGYFEKDCGLLCEGVLVGGVPLGNWVGFPRATPVPFFPPGSPTWFALWPCVRVDEESWSHHCGAQRVGLSYQTTLGPLFTGHPWVGLRAVLWCRLGCGEVSVRPADCPLSKSPPASVACGP